jgi:hypothetical protein
MTPEQKLNRHPGNRPRVQPLAGPRTGSAVIRDHQEEAASPGRSRLSALRAPAGMTSESGSAQAPNALALLETPRGIRNNNPGNIRHSKVCWVGEADDQPDPDFVTFCAPEYGIRAICKTLLSYQSDDRCRTLRQLISRWAPPSENDTDSYLAAVSRACGLGPDAAVGVRQAAVMTPLVEAIIRQETGLQPYPPALIAEALSLAGIGPTPRPIPPASGQPA